MQCHSAFATLSEAKIASEKLRTRRENFGTSSTALSPVIEAEAKEALKLLDGLNVSLLEAYVRTHKARLASISLGDAFDKYTELKAGKSGKYLNEIRYTKGKFEPLLDKMVCDITHNDLEEILDQFPASSRNANIRRLSSVFNLAVKRGWMGGKPSPLTPIDFSDTEKGEVEIFRVDQVRALLEHALEHDLDLLPYRVFTFFCGVRPEGELERLEWSDVRLAQKTVVMRPEITKTKRKRFIELSDNAIAWLTEYQGRGGEMTGLVAP
jgi:integrase